MSEKMNLIRQPPDSFVVLRFGKNSYSQDGADHQLIFTADDADRIISEFNRRAKDIVIDYEHQSIQGSEAPAAGWISALKKNAEGLIAIVKNWTDKGADYLSKGEYRYFSPVIFRQNGMMRSLHSVALTNHPAIHGLDALVASDVLNTSSPIHQPKGTTNMDPLRQIAAVFNVPAPETSDGEPAFIAALLETCRTFAATAAQAETFLRENNCPDFDSMMVKIKGMIPAETHAELTEKLRQYEAEKAVEQAFADRKLTEVQRPWALRYAQENLTAFSDFIAKSPAIVPGGAGSLNLGSKITHASDTLSLSDIQVRLLRASGANETQIERIKKGEK